jgi:hypothetical protein
VRIIPPGTRNRIQNPELNKKEIRGKSLFAEVTGPTGPTGPTGYTGLYELPVYQGTRRRTPL